MNKCMGIASKLDLLDFDWFIDNYNKKSETVKAESSASLKKNVESESDPKYFTAVENLLIQYSLVRIIEELNIINLGCAKRISDEKKKIWGGRQPFNERVAKHEMREHIFFSPTMQELKEGMMSMFYIKISCDVEWCTRVLKATQIELQKTGFYNSLAQTLATDKANEDEEFALIEEYTKHKRYVEYLENKLAEFKAESSALLVELDNEISTMENKIHDIRIESAIKSRFIRKWETTRLHQGASMVKKSHRRLTCELDDARQRLDIESRAINEIENFIKYEIEKIEEQTEFWQKKYDTEIEQLDDAIQISTENINELQQTYEEMKELYEARSAEIEDYWEKKRLAAEEIALAEKKWKCAIIIQAWWRGTMVRRHLGPYKKKKKCKGAKAGKGKKK